MLVNFSARTRINATAPNDPIRWSRMMRSTSSRVRPPPKPSAMSATPSRWSARVIHTAVAVIRTASTDDGRATGRANTWLACAATRKLIQSRADCIAPMPAPTRGKNAEECPTSTAPTSQVLRSGIRVRNMTATTKRFNSPLPSPSPVCRSPRPIRMWPCRRNCALRLR